MFIAASTSLVLSTFIIFCLRGNITIPGWRTLAASPEQGDAKKIIIAKQLLPFPIAYVFLILPVSVARLMGWAGENVTFAGLIFCVTIYLLSGAVNVLLFVILHLLPAQSLCIRKSTISHPMLQYTDTFDFGSDSEPQNELPGAATRLEASTTMVARPSAVAASFPSLPSTPPLFSRSASYRSDLPTSTYKEPPKGVPTDVEASDRDSMESLYTNRMYQSPLEEVQLGSGGRFPSISTGGYANPPWR